MEGTKCFQIITGNYLLKKTNLITLLIISKWFFLTATCLKINDYHCLTDRWWIPNIEWCNKSSWLVCRPRLMESGTCSTPERYRWCKDSCCWFTSNGTSSWRDSNARRYNKGNVALLLIFFCFDRVICKRKLYVLHFTCEKRVRIWKNAYIL